MDSCLFSNDVLEGRVQTVSVLCCAFDYKALEWVSLIPWTVTLSSSGFTLLFRLFKMIAQLTTPSADLTNTASGRACLDLSAFLTIGLGSFNRISIFDRATSFRNVRLLCSCHLWIHIRLSRPFASVRSGPRLRLWTNLASIADKVCLPFRIPYPRLLPLVLGDLHTKKVLQRYEEAFVAGITMAQPTKLPLYFIYALPSSAPKSWIEFTPSTLPVYCKKTIFLI